MTFKEADQILIADPRFASLYVSDENGIRVLGLADHHCAIAAVDLSNQVPQDVRTAFDRARNTLLYAFFAYDLLIVGSTQAFAAFELALRNRLASYPINGNATLRSLVDRGRKHGVLPPLQASAGSMAPLEAMVHLRNALAHGTADVYSPGVAMQVLEICAREIDCLFPPREA